MVDQKPQAIHLYNEAMPGVDLGDQKRHGKQVARRMLSRWYKKFFFHLLDIRLVNSHCISQHVPELVGMKHSEFRLCLVAMILRTFGEDERQPLAHRPIGVSSLAHLTERHCNIGHTETPRRCAVCSAIGIRKQSRYYCVDCNNALCPSPCFYIFHTQEDISRHT